MAHQIKSDTVVNFGSPLSIARPKIAPIVADTVLEWCLLEQYVASLFASLLGLHKSNDIPNFGWHSHPAAFEMFEILGAMRVRLDLISKLLSTHTDNQDEIDHWRKVVMPAVRDAADRRNRVFHGLWGFSQQYPNDLIRYVGSKPMAFTESDFDETKTLIVKAKIMVAEFNGTLQRELRK
jgi:hypothetical protein